MDVRAPIGRTTGAFGAAALILPLCGPPLRADDGTAKDARTVLFGSLDAGDSTFASFGFKRALSGDLDHGGPAALVSAGSGVTRERSDVGMGRVDRHTLQASALAGWQWSFERVFAGAFVGPEIDQSRLDLTGSARTWMRGARWGARVQAEIWSHPTPDTLLAATAVAGTARGHVWARAAGGYRAWRNVYAGPEIALYRTDTDREWRVGAHLTGVEIGGLTVSLSGGWRQLEQAKHGFYVNLSGYWRR